MSMLDHLWTEEEIEKISYDLAIARAKIYKKWKFSIEEIATLIDLPESQVRDELSKEIEVAYTCDQQQCANCSAEEGFCYHTTDIHHAVNFKEVAPGRFMEEPV